MMGVIILTADPEPFREGVVVEDEGITCPPTAPNTTFIFHMRTVKVDRDIERWLDIVAYRMVLVVDKAPTLKGDLAEQVIVHRSLDRRERSWRRECEALMKWTDRQRAFGMVKDLPPVLATRLIEHNRKDDMALQRLLASVRFTLPDEYTLAAATFGVKPTSARYEWPKRAKKVEQPPPQFRESDVHWPVIVALSPKVRNDIRAANLEDPPAGMKKRRERVHSWV